MRVPVAVMVIASLGGLAAPARADDDTDDRTEVIIADVVADAVIIGGMGSKRPQIGLIGVGMYAFVPPILHATHGKKGAAGWSLGLRIGAPILLGAIGCGVFGDDDDGDSDGDGERGADWGCVAGAMGGVVLGMLGAQITDWAVLSGADDDGNPTARMFRIGGSF